MSLWDQVLPWNGIQGIDPSNEHNPVFGAGGVMGKKPVNLVGMERPTPLAYQQSYDPRTMSMTPALQGQLNGNQLNQAGLNKYRGEAMRTGPSAWAGLANQQQSAEQMNQQNLGARQAASAGADARSQLAMGGGLSSGASERVAREQGRNYLGMSQNAAQQGAQNRMQVGLNDEQNRISQLGSLPGMDVAAHGAGLQDINAWAQGKQFDVGNQVNEGRAQNLFNSEQYKNQMAAWGANNQANATAQSGKK